MPEALSIICTVRLVLLLFSYSCYLYLLSQLTYLQPLWPVQGRCLKSPLLRSRPTTEAFLQQSDLGNSAMKQRLLCSPGSAGHQASDHSSEIPHSCHASTPTACVVMRICAGWEWVCVPSDLTVSNLSNDPLQAHLIMSDFGWKNIH